MMTKKYNQQIEQKHTYGTSKDFIYKKEKSKCNIISKNKMQ